MMFGAVEQLVARWAHNPEVARSNRAGATLCARLVLALVFAASASTLHAQTIYWTGAIATSGSDCVVSTNCFVVTDLRAVPSLGVYVDVGTSGTFAFEATIDGATWFSVTDDIAGATTTTADGAFYFTNPGWRSFRVRASAISGTATLSASRGNANLRSTATITGATATQGPPAATTDATAWPVKVVFGSAQVDPRAVVFGGSPIDPRDTSDRAGRLLGQVTFSAPQHTICDSGCSGTALGQTTMSASLPVAIASDQGAVPVSATFWPTAVATPSSTRLSDGGSFYDARSIRALTSSDQVTIVQPTGANLHVNCDSGCGGTTLGQTTMAASLPVAIASNQSAVPVSGTFWQTTQPVSIATLPALIAGSAVIGHVIVDTAPSTAVTGPLTDTQLRATPVPVSGTVATGGLTDTQIRATALPVSGTVSANATLTAETTKVIGTVNVAAGQSIAVTGPLTDTQIRATPVPVSGTVTANISGSISNTSFTATQATGSNLHVQVDSAPTTAVTISSDVPGVGATNSGKAEDAAHTSGDTGVMALMVRKDTNAQFTNADGDYSPLAVDAYGVAYVALDHPNRIRCTVTTSTATTIQAVGTSCATPGAGLSLYVTDILFSASAAGIAADAFPTLKYGTGGTCGTGTTVFWGALTAAAIRTSDSLHTPIKIPANNEICWISTTAGSKFLVLAGYIAP